MLADELRYKFSAPVRKRGAKYQHQGRVNIVRSSECQVHAIVKGTTSYATTIEFDYDRNSINLGCTCPHYSSNNMCKHLWATVLESDKQGLRFNSMDDLDDLEAFLEPDFEEEDVSHSNTRNWQDMMAKVQSSFHPHHNPRAFNIGNIAYMINLRETMTGRGLILDVMHRRPRKDGKGFTKFQPVNMPIDNISLLPDPTDRKILSLLFGSTTIERNYDGYRPQTNGSQFMLTNSLAKIILPECAQTGRLSLTRHRNDYDDPHILSYDQNGSWKLHLHVSENNESDDYLLTGELRRNDEHMPLSAPHMLTAEGFVFAENTFADFDDAGMFGWIIALRDAETVRIPKEDGLDWLKTALERAKLPPATLPESLQYKELSVDPIPYLKFFTSNKIDKDDNYFGAILSFEYNEWEAPYDPVSKSIFDPESRFVIRRNKDSEDNFIKILRKFGFQEALQYPPSYSYYATEPRYDQKMDFEILERKFAKAIITLIKEGWKIEADGLKYKTSSSININVRSGINWFELDGAADFDGESVPFPKILQAIKKGESSITLGDGSTGILPEEWLERYKLIAGSVDTDGDSAKFSRSQAVLMDALLAAEPSIKLDKVFASFIKELHKFKSIKPVSKVAGFKCNLRDYQADGLGWFKFLQKMRFGGCLADDMGLGKTVQALGILQARRRREGRTSLVVVPKSIVLNWKQEAHRFAPGLRVLTHTGSDRNHNADAFSDYDLIITTYGLLRRDILMLKDFNFDYVILDEAQAIKNNQTATSKAARLLSSEYRLAMSGTPIENHLGELWSLFEFLNPGMLGALPAFSSLIKPTSSGEISADHTVALSRALRPFILRRTKEQVAPELPKKTEETIFCELTTQQRKTYNQIRDYYKDSLMNKVDTEGINKQKLIILEALLRLRQIACHPGLIDSKKAGHSSAKLDILLEQIEDVVEEDHKILVFSQFTTMLGIVRSRLDSKNVVYEYLDGKTRKRGEKVERFQTDPECKVFLISLKAGGLGLNLTAADYVVLLDPWWNPAVEMQAIDRAHRIGQKKPVFAYRLIAKDTVEERIMELQQTKKNLADSIISADTSIIRSLTRKDLEFLLA